MDSKKVEILINKPRLEKRLDEMAKMIMQEYKEKDIAFVGILKGAAFFMVELAKRIKNNVRFEFIEVSSYEGTESTGEIKLNKDITSSIEGKDVIIVEDIIDTGMTLTYLKEHILQKNPKSLKICTLLSKPSKRVVELEVDYIGFSIGDEFVVGFGMDFNQDYRNLPYIGVIK